MSTSYTKLKTDVPLILMAQNRSLEDNMETILQEAQDFIYGVLDHDAFRTKLADVTVGTSSSIIDLSQEDPQVLELRAFRLTLPGQTNKVPIERRDIDYLQMVYANGIPGQPLYYAELDAQLNYEVYPNADIDYTITPEVNQEVPYLSSTVETNLISIWYPRVIEKAALHQGALFMKDDSQIKRYKGEMTQAVVEANAQIKRRRRDNTGPAPVDNTNTGV